MLNSNYILNWDLHALSLMELVPLEEVFEFVMSNTKGLQFEGYLRNSMGTVELRDQIEGLKYLNTNSIVDIKRVCITGWSYGKEEYLLFIHGC